MVPGFASCQAAFRASGFREELAGCRCDRVRKGSVAALYRAFGSPVDPPACGATDFARCSSARASPRHRKMSRARTGLPVSARDGLLDRVQSLREGRCGSHPGRCPRKRISAVHGSRILQRNSWLGTRFVSTQQWVRRPNAGSIGSSGNRLLKYPLTLPFSELVVPLRSSREFVASNSGRFAGYLGPDRFLEHRPQGPVLR